MSDTPDTPSSDRPEHPKPDPRPGGKRIVLRLTARDKEDNADAIRQVREILKAAGRPLRIETVPAPDPAEVEPQPPAPALAVEPPRNVSLEIKIGKEVEVKLAQKAAADPSPAPDPAKAEEVKKGLWKWLGGKLKAGWRVTVGAVVEAVMKKSAG